jgi:hypothetical protein
MFFSIMKTSQTQSGLIRLLLFVVPFAFTFCGDDEGSLNFSYKVDGESQQVGTVSAFLESEIQYDHEGRALSITAAVGFSKMLIVSVSNWDFQNPPDNGILTGEYDATFDFESNEENPLAECLALDGDNTGVTLCEGALVTYILDGEIYTSVFGDAPEATITITECNTGNRTVSGTFTAKMQNFDTEEVLTITGSFSKVKYTIQ